MMRIPVNKPTITGLEYKYVDDAIRTGWGDHCYDYINKFTNLLKDTFKTKYAWPTSSCHGAIHTILVALGIGPGDEVIVPDVTWIGSASPICWVGAKPVFVDILEDTWCVDPISIEKNITSKTKAIIVVHLYGSVCEMDEIMSISKKYNLPVIEDAAEAVGSEYKGRLVGSIADFGVFSFHGTKTFTTGEGGAIVSSRDDLADKISTICNQGRKPGQHIMFWVDEIGLKYKMSNLDAALGCAQFERFDELVAKKRQIFEWYAKELKDVPDTKMNVEQSYAKSLYWMPSIIFGDTYSFDREQLIRKMNADGIGVRPFFFPISMFPMFDDCPWNSVSYRLYVRGINLPSYHDMTRDEVKDVCRSLLINLDV
ncbi:MAG: DegT/DnrJ/EryC1/StrS family aminotransferase [Methanomassiliicoccaceae archaeon]|nr:DegT/DnrJ/EryC1/StrS family aminotransferase [Methanomassiliicoccaceae archaeon]